MNRTQYLYPFNTYRGKFKPEFLVFNFNLQEFAQKVGYIANLQTSGKLSSAEAYEQVECLWHQLHSSQQDLGIGGSLEG